MGSAHAGHYLVCLKNFATVVPAGELARLLESRMLDLAGHKLVDPFNDVKRRLAKAVLQFQDQFVDLRVDSGSLVQVLSSYAVLPESLCHASLL